MLGGLGEAIQENACTPSQRRESFCFWFDLNMRTYIKGRSRTLEKRPGRILEGDAHVLVIDKQAKYRCGQATIVTLAALHVPRLTLEDNGTPGTDLYAANMR